LDAGAQTIAWHLAEQHRLTVSEATIWRTLQRAGLITPEPNKKPKAAYICFAAEQPNEMWQTDFTHYRLTRPDLGVTHRCGDRCRDWPDDSDRGRHAVGLDYLDRECVRTVDGAGGQDG